MLEYLIFNQNIFGKFDLINLFSLQQS